MCEISNINRTIKTSKTFKTRKKNVSKETIKVS
jgi:hypothetical protein